MRGIDFSPSQRAKDISHSEHMAVSSRTSCILLLVFVLYPTSSNAIGANLTFAAETSNGANVTCEVWNPCKNGATCTDGPILSCECPPGFSGVTCANSICVSNQVVGEVKIGHNQAGGLVGPLEANDRYGRAVEGLGDIDDDGVPDLAVGAIFDDDGGTDRGAVYILLLNKDRSVKEESKISSTQGGLVGPLRDKDKFGVSLANLGDVDRNGMVDLAVGAIFDDDDGNNRGAVYILLLNKDRTVKEEKKISSAQGGLEGPLANGDKFGISLAVLGDLDRNGMVDLAVGTNGDDDGGADRGAVYILLLTKDRTVKVEQKISSTQGGLIGPLDDGDWFGRSIAAMGDLDGNGMVDLAVGAIFDDDGGDRAGAVYVLLLNMDMTVKEETKISAAQGGLVGPLKKGDRFGTSIAVLGDVDRNGMVDLAVGVNSDDDGGADRGAVYVMLLYKDRTVKKEQKISSTHGGLGPLDKRARFGVSMTVLGGRGENGLMDLAVGAMLDSESRGAVYILGVPPGFVEPLCGDKGVCIATMGGAEYTCDAEVLGLN